MSKNRVILTLGVSIFIISMAWFLFPAKKNSPVSESAQMAVHLLTYISGDYGGAVADGKVLHEGEYNEQVEFASEAEVQLKNLGFVEGSEIVVGVQNLRQLIIKKLSSAEVSKLAIELVGKLAQKSGMKTYPSTWPIQSKGKAIFEASCASCHGEKGGGDGRLAARMSPKPANFLDLEKMAKRSPFQIFNTLQVGVPNTGMVSFRFLGEENIWALAFYVSSLRFQEEKSKAPNVPAKHSENELQLAASNSDEELFKLLSGTDFEKKKEIVKMRIWAGPQSDVSVAAVTGTSAENPVEKTRRLLKAATLEFESGNKSIARKMYFSAYLDGFETVEKSLKAAGHHNLVSDIEIEMAKLRANTEKLNREDVEAILNSIHLKLDQAHALLTAQQDKPWFSFVGALSVILREGFEAILIIISLLGVVRISSAKKAEKWIHGGWIVALGVGVLSWFAATTLMAASGLQIELLEGLTAAFAVLVLVYMGFWLHGKSEIVKWTAFIDAKVTKSLNENSYLGLGLLSFVAVFREAFETVLFLKALWLDGGVASQSAILAGLAVGVGGLVIMAVLMLRFAKRMPIQKMFFACSAVMVALAVILTGKGIHSFQEAGVLSDTRLTHMFSFELFGVYSNLETILGQSLLILMIVAIGLVRMPKGKITGVA